MTDKTQKFTTIIDVFSLSIMVVNFCVLSVMTDILLQISPHSHHALRQVRQHHPAPRADALRTTEADAVTADQTLRKKKTESQLLLVNT